MTQRCALDLLRLGPAGVRARGLCPARLDRYAIYGTEVTSPCAGVVAAAVDDFADLMPAVPVRFAGRFLVRNDRVVTGR